MWHLSKEFMWKKKKKKSCQRERHMVETHGHLKQ